MIFQIYLIFTIILLSSYYLSGRKKWKLPPGPRGLPILGNTLAISRRPYQTFTKWRNIYGDVYCCKFPMGRVVFLGRVQLVKECFNNPAFNGRPGIMSFSLLSKTKNGLLLSEGQEWTEQRRFTIRHLRDFGFGKKLMEDLIMDEVSEFTAELSSYQGRPQLINGHRFELPVLNSLWMIMTGKRFVRDDDPHLKILRDFEDQVTKPSITKAVNFIAPSLFRFAPELLGWTKYQKVYSDLYGYLNEIIQEHEDTLPDAMSSRDFIDDYLHEIRKTVDPTSSFYKDAGVQSLITVIKDLFFTGGETSSSTLAWAVLYLALNPQIQKKLQQELDEVVGKSRRVALDDKPNLPYTEATILEILRKSALVCAGVMHRAMEDSTISGYDIPKDTWIAPNIYAIHHDPEIWGDPHTFRPERFLSEDGKTVQKSENLLAFSLGKRVCLGENLARDEVFLFLTNIFQRFNIITDPSKPAPTYEPKVRSFLLHVEDFYVIVEDRV